MKELKMCTSNIVEENIAKLATLFPGCVTESTVNNGSLNKSVDFDLLKQELSTVIVEGAQERYHLNWPGKRKALLSANAPIAKTLRPYREESVDFDTTENLFVEGDNLDALKLLQETYLGKVKMIYIDPPYNTGKDFIYRDNFAESAEEYLLDSGQINAAGNRLIANTDSNGRFHSDWLSMMYSRLKLARNLLQDNGVIFVSIDNHEVDNLKKLCSEVFGEENFISELIWKSGRTAAAHFTNEHEYILCFGKSKMQLPLFEYDGDECTSDRAIKRPTVKNPVSAITFPAGIDFESEDKVFPSKFGKAEPIKITHGTLESKNRKLANEVTIEAAWTMRDMILNWLQGNEVYDQKGQKVIRFFFKLNGILQYEKEKGTIHPKSIIEGYTTKQGGFEIKDLLGTNYFDFPKPKGLISLLASFITKGDDIVLDFFAGSATTAHAVMQLNFEDGGKRRFIMVQLPEICDEKSEAFEAGFKTIAEIGKERIRLTGAKIKSENATTAANLDTGFRVFKVDSSNMTDVYYTPDTIAQKHLKFLTDNIKHDRDSEDLLFQVLLDWGMSLTSPICKNTVGDLEVFFVDKLALVACFEKDGKIDEKFCKVLAKSQPQRVVFRDSGFKDDSMKINVEQIFKLMSPHTDVKTI